MTSNDKSKPGLNTPDEMGVELAEDIQANKRIEEELSFLFGEDIVEQTSHIDIVDLNLNKAITDSIAKGVKQLKELKNRPEAQLSLIKGMSPGEKMVLCLWIKEMELLRKIQNKPYTSA